MPTFTTYAPGTPCWVDLLTPDVDASSAFYKAVFGWEVEDQFDGEQRVYTMYRRDGQKVTGAIGQGPQTQGMPAMWTTYIAVDDVDAAIAAVGAAGGSLMMGPMDISPAGKMAVFSDPTGAALAVWQPGDHLGAEVANEPDTWSWNELVTRDVDAAKDFYASVFGWQYDSMDMGGGNMYHVIAGGENGGLGGLMQMPAEFPPMVPNHWAVYFMVDDLDDRVAKVTANGGKVVNPPMAVPGVGTMAHVHDPAGGAFAMLRPESAG